MAKIDYAKDESWDAWNRDALRRFLNEVKSPPNVTAQNLVVDFHPVTALAPPKRSIHEEAWWQPCVTPVVPPKPSVREDKQEVGGLASIFGDYSQAMALDDDMWEIPTVRLDANSGASTHQTIN
jgi:hypothetical protein